MEKIQRLNNIFDNSSITYTQYLEDDGERYEEDNYVKYARLNFHRIKRIEKSLGNAVGDDFYVDTDLTRCLVITETWCGDSAQNLPYINMLCDVSGIDLKIAFRDDSDIIDDFLTDGKKSIPKVVFFNNDGYVEWGPSPQHIIEYTAEFKEQDDPDWEEFNIYKQKWYNKNKGYDATIEMIEKINNGKIQD